MKNNVLIYRIIGLFCFFAFAVNIEAQHFAEKAVYKESYAATKGLSLEVLNKYGDIKIANWDKDSISITTEVLLSASSIKKLERIKKSVNVNYTMGVNHLTAETHFASNTDIILNELETFIENLTMDNSKQIKIDYLIYVPDYIALNIRNQYGDVTIDNVKERCDISMSNGAFKANILSGTSHFDLRFVQAQIHQLNDADLNMFYSDMDVNKAISLNCDSKMSNLNAKTIGVLKMHSGRDKLHVKSLSYLYGSSNYTKLRIDSLKNELDFDMSYGEILVDYVHPSCSNIALLSERTDVELYLPKRTAFSYDLLFHESCMLHLPIKNENKATTYNGEAMYKSVGKTAGTPTLNLHIKAFKRCSLKVQYVF